MNLNGLKQWAGRTETVEDAIALAPLHAMAATLDHDGPAPGAADPLAPCWHWLYFLPAAPLSTLGPDGHPQRGGSLPPVPLPRRMWVAGRMDFLRPLRVGSPIRRTSRIADVSSKQGRTGPLVFVRVHHELHDTSGVCLAEVQDIVYRDTPQAGDAPPAAPAARTDEQFCRRLDPDPVLLFRYSALTFNGHRIHYDRPYATGVEGYPAWWSMAR